MLSQLETLSREIETGNFVHWAHVTLTEMVTMGTYTDAIRRTCRADVTFTIPQGARFNLVTSNGEIATGYFEAYTGILYTTIPLDSIVRMEK